MLTERIFSIAQIADQTILYLLIALSILSFGLILERYFTLRKVISESNKIRARIKLALTSQSISDIEELSRDVTSIEGRATNHAMKHIKEAGSKGLEELFSSITIVEKGELDKHLSFLATIGSNSPYIGLLGTVLGIMKAFNDLATSTEAGQQTVMAGISSALVATAAGLFVAIPAVLFYNHFQKQVKSIVSNIDLVKEMCLAHAKKRGL